jgi:TetR/AcrR family transcriptional regulator
VQKPYSVLEERIIEASVQLFSCRGFKGTSTRQIAHLANVSEATLFRHFPRKTGLFWTAAESRLKQLKLGRDLQNSLANDLDPAQVVPLIVTFLVDIVVQQPQLLRLLYVAANEMHGSERMFREHLGPIFDSVNTYFGRCVAKGIVNNLDPSMVTLGMAAAIATHSSLHQLFAYKDLRCNPEETARGHSRLWLNAICQGDGRAVTT